MKRLWDTYSLGMILAVLMLISWALQTWGGWHVYLNDQVAHGGTPAVFGPDGYIWHWLEATFENWQSEFLQLFAFVLLSKYFIYKGSPQSRDGDDEIKAKLDALLARNRNL